MALLCYLDFRGDGGGKINRNSDGEDNNVSFIMRTLEPVRDEHQGLAVNLAPALVHSHGYLRRRITMVGVSRKKGGGKGRGG